MTPSACARQAAIDLLQGPGADVRALSSLLDDFYARGVAEAPDLASSGTLRRAFREVVQDRNRCLMALDKLWRTRRNVDRSVFFGKAYGDVCRCLNEKEAPQ